VRQIFENRKQIPKSTNTNAITETETVSDTTTETDTGIDTQRHKKNQWRYVENVSIEEEATIFLIIIYVQIVSAHRKAVQRII